LEQLTVWCCTAALRDAGWWEWRQEVRLGLVLGVGAEWLVKWEGDALQGGRRVDHPAADQESLVMTVRRLLGLSGPAASVSAACASGNYALAQARRWLELGWADVCLAGACDMAVSPMSLAGFGNLRALSRRNAAEVDYINAHATSTPRGDEAEARVLEAVLGEAVCRVPVSSTKSMTGHLLTAAAAVEALACLVAMQRGAVPPTINLHNPDLEC